MKVTLSIPDNPFTVLANMNAELDAMVKEELDDIAQKVKEDLIHRTQTQTKDNELAKKVEKSDGKTGNLTQYDVGFSPKEQVSKNTQDTPTDEKTDDKISAEDKARRYEYGGYKEGKGVEEHQARSYYYIRPLLRHYYTNVMPDKLFVVQEKMREMIIDKVNKTFGKKIFE